VIGTLFTRVRTWPVVASYRARLVIATASIAILGSGCDAAFPGKPDPKNRPVPTDKVMSFEALYGANCAGCHGKDGTLGPAPPLNDKLFRSIIPTSALKEVLTQGRRATPMPGFEQSHGGLLTSAQIQVLISEIKGEPYRLNDRDITAAWGPVPQAADSVPPYSSTQVGGNAARGATLFDRACSGCHGENGKGKPDGDRQVNRINDPVFLSLISDQALRRIIITGRPDLKMPNYSEMIGRPDDFQPLTSSEIGDLVALLASWRK
jgi:mono/diheme cytochrome c family protein